MVDLLQNTNTEKNTEKDKVINTLKEGNRELEKMYKEIRYIYDLLVKSNNQNIEEKKELI